MANKLKIKDLTVSVDKKQILKNLSLEIKSGELHILMGPNGSGKTTLVNTIMGNPNTKIKSGKITLDKTDLSKLKIYERANSGIFVAFQNPTEIPGISIRSFLRTALNSKITQNNKNAKTYSPIEFIELLQETTKKFNLDTDLLLREVNTNMSGGEKKKSEILQMAILQPKFAILDEIDSGLDIDTLRKIAKSIQKIQKEFNTGILIITHFTRILKYLNPDFVHIFKNGEITKTGDKKLALQLEKKGYDQK